MNTIRWLAFAAIAVSFSTIAQIRVISWNAESGEAPPSTFSKNFSHINEIVFYSLSEVSPPWEQVLEQPVEKDEDIDYGSVLGTTGGADPLQILYNSNRFELVNHSELANINIGGNLRAPLFDRFRNKEDGDSGHDQGYGNFIDNGVSDLVRPAYLIKTQCSPSYNSVLDFIFVSNLFKQPENKSEILLTETSYCTDNTSEESDHRPINALIGTSVTVTQNAVKDQILRSVAKIEEELATL
jgi:hypothetical protein